MTESKIQEARDAIHHMLLSPVSPECVTLFQAFRLAKELLRAEERLSAARRILTEGR